MAALCVCVGVWVGRPEYRGVGVGCRECVGVGLWVGVHEGAL